jgi:hypothetical protein
MTGKRQPMDLSIIIVNWNSADYLRACLASIFRETRELTFEVIVIDNASNDGSEEIVRTEFPEVIFIQSAENLGFARANNLGFAHSTGECILFLNPDTEILGNSLATMVACLRANETTGAAGPTVLNTDGSLQVSIQSFPTITNQVLDFEVLRRVFPRARIWGTRALYGGEGNAADVDVISGACFMVKRSVFQRVGLFSEEYFMYSDDFELSYKIKRAGFSIRYARDGRVVHHGGKSSEKREDHFSEVLQRKSLAQFLRQTRGPLYSFAYRFAMAGVAIIRMGLVVCLAALGKKDFNGKSFHFVLQKWMKILGWTLGFEGWPAASARTTQ